LKNTKTTINFTNPPTTDPSTIYCVNVIIQLQNQVTMSSLSLPFNFKRINSWKLI